MQHRMFWMSRYRCGAVHAGSLQVFEPYGDIYRLRTFPEQEAAALEFSDTAAAARVRHCLVVSTCQDLLYL